MLLHRPARRRRRLPDRGAPGGALGPRVGGRGRPTTPSRRCARRGSRPRPRGRSGARGRAALASPRAGAAAAAAGPGPLVADRVAVRAATTTRSARRRTQAELLLERYGIVTREQVLAEGIPGGFSSLYDSLAALETIGVARRGYFVEGLGGAQFALPGRGRAAARAARRRRGAPARARRHRSRRSPTARVLQVAAARRGRARARQAGAYVVLAGAEPVLYVERGGKGLQMLVDGDDPRIEPRSRRWPTPSSAAASSGWRSSGSTASRSSAPPTRNRCSSSASAPARASSP